MASRRRKNRKGKKGSAPAPAPGGDGAEGGTSGKRAPSVMQFLEKLGGAPSAPRGQTAAKGLLGKINRQELVDAGRIDANSPQGPPPDPHPTVPQRLDGLEEALDDGLAVEVSTPDGAAVGRREPRLAWKEMVRVASVLAGPHRPGKAGNLSTSGIFIETTQLLDIDDPVVLSFPTEGGAPLNVSGRVRWVSPFGDAKDAQPGMGIEFVGLDARKRSRVEGLLAGLPVAEEPR